MNNTTPTNLAANAGRIRIVVGKSSSTIPNRKPKDIQTQGDKSVDNFKHIYSFPCQASSGLLSPPFASSEIPAIEPRRLLASRGIIIVFESGVAATDSRA